MATEPSPPLTHFVVSSSLAALFEDIEFAQTLFEVDSEAAAKAARDFAMGSANVFVDCCSRAGFDASVAIGEERGSLSAVIKVKGKRSSYSGTFKAKAAK